MANPLASIKNAFKPPKIKFSKSPLGEVGVDNPRQNLDPNIITKAIHVNEIRAKEIRADTNSTAAIQYKDVNGAVFINIDTTNGRTGFGDSTSQTAPAGIVHISKNSSSAIALRIQRSTTLFCDWIVSSGNFPATTLSANAQAASLGVYNQASGSIGIGDVGFGSGTITGSPDILFHLSTGFTGFGTAAPSQRIHLSSGNFLMEEPANTYRYFEIDRNGSGVGRIGTNNTFMTVEGASEVDINIGTLGASSKVVTVTATNVNSLVKLSAATLTAVNGFTGTGAFTTWTISGGIIISAA